MRSESKPANGTSPRFGQTEVLRPRDNAVRHLTALSRDLEARMRIGLVENQGFASLRASLGPLFFLLWTRPSPITVLARQLGVTKQACSQLANLAERAGYLDRIQSPDDGRSKLLHLSKRGRRLVEGSIEIIRRADSDYAGVVGARRYAKFTKTIAALYTALDLPDAPRLDFLEQSTRTVGTLPLITQRAQQALMHATAAHGHPGLKLSHSQVLPFVGPTGTRISDLVRIHGASRQAIAGIARDLDSLGYLDKKSDPADRRGAILFLSPRGEELVADSLVELETLERRIARALGRSALSEFLETAARLAASIDAEEDIFDVSSSTTSTQSIPSTPGTTATRSTPSSATRTSDQSGEVRQGSKRIDLDAEMRTLAEQLHHELGDQKTERLAELLSEQAASTSR